MGLCKDCIHTEVCWLDKNTVGTRFVPGNPMLVDNKARYKEYEKWRDAGFPCVHYVKRIELPEPPKEAAELLKEQDKPTRPVYNGRYWECEQCKLRYKDILAVKEYKHCPGCGRRIEWN